MSKRILITGAGSGLGKGTALGLARAGHQVIAGVELWNQVSSLRAAAQDSGVEFKVIKLDICDPIDRVAALRNEVDILVNNAGIGETGPLAEIPLERFRRVFEVNVFAGLELTQAFAAQFAARRSGKIVFLSSMAGLSTYPFLGPYNASKHAIEAIAQCLANELKDLGVQVCTINPGPYGTGFNDRMYETLDQWYDPSRNYTPEGPIRKIQAEIGPGQFDPQAMIDLMVDTIPKDHHKFRTMLPEAIETWCKDYQARMWTDTI